MIRYGYSWPGRQPRTRHWVSYDGWLVLWMAAGVACYVLAWLLLIGPLWLAAQTWLLLWSCLVYAWAYAQLRYTGRRFMRRWHRLPAGLRVMRLREVTPAEGGEASQP